MAILLLHVGCDTTDKCTLGQSQPFFPHNKSFEYIPIREGDKTIERRTYSAIKCRAHPGHLCDYIKDNYRNNVPHIDPNFDTWTYGDPDEKLQSVQPGDIAVFLGSFADWNLKVSKIGNLQAQVRTRAKYVFACMPLRGLYKLNFVKGKPKFDVLNGSPSPNGSIGRQLRENAHVKRMVGCAYIVLGDSRRARLLEKAVRITNRNYALRGGLGRLISRGLRKKGKAGKSYRRGSRWIRDSVVSRKIYNFLLCCP